MLGGSTFQFLSLKLVQKAPGTPGNVTHHTYDLAGRQISVTRGYGTSNASTTTYTYYDDGRKQSETDALGHVTTYAYDAAGRLTSVSGVQGNMQYGYDDAGNQISRTDGNGNTTGETRVAQERDRHLRLWCGQLPRTAKVRPA